MLNCHHVNVRLPYLIVLDWFPPHEFLSIVFPIGTWCVDPPDLSTQNVTLVSFINGSLVNFNDVVTYECLQGLHFNSSYDKTNFTLECKDTGAWELSDGDFCVDPASKIRLRVLGLG